MLRLCVAVVVVVVACALPQPNIKHLKPGGFEVSVDGQSNLMFIMYSDYNIMIVGIK
ncbi:hypothetical protein DPMN_176238 [Dreissena polymorpha]|uniref:Uncharacterized protein n=1 Tax=Dreissena polymorpha TaxID=45954 RepID=A0A9D4IHX8_DREPO|nr:hypothetical protein DPMN_176238 [Dreissena polymorpha]